MKSIPLLLLSSAAALVVSCTSTSLSNPGGSGHGEDLNLYELTGDKPQAQVTERDIAAALGSRSGSLPVRGGKILLVQSGAHQPDQELAEAFRPLGQIVEWNGQAQEPGSQEKNDKRFGGAIGRRLRLVAAQQGCTHVVVVFGEIQSAARDLPTDAVVGWIPIVGSLVPGEVSGTRLFAQALVMEVASPRYSVITASPRQESGLNVSGSQSSVNVRRSLRLKKLIYPELAAKCFR